MVAPNENKNNLTPIDVVITPNVLNGMNMVLRYLIKTQTTMQYKNFIDTFCKEYDIDHDVANKSILDFLDHVSSLNKKLISHGAAPMAVEFLTLDDIIDIKVKKDERHGRTE